MAEIIDCLKIVVLKMGSADIEELLNAAAKQLGGGGGGKPDLAQSGGPNVERLDGALVAGREAMRAGRSLRSSISVSFSPYSDTSISDKGFPDG